jgi:hypothetical protein
MVFGSFKTIPNPLRQIPDKNLIIPKAPLKSICFKEINIILSNLTGCVHPNLKLYNVAKEIRVDYPEIDTTLN